MQFRQSLFWDTDSAKLDSKKNAKYIIERIMDFGNDQEVHWMREHYSKSFIAEVCNNSKVLHPSSKTLWTLLTQI